MSQPSGACVRPQPREPLEAGDAAGGDRPERAGGDQVHADPATARGHAPDTARRTRARPWRRPSSRRSATRRRRRSRARRCSRRSASAARARPPAPSARTRSSGTPASALSAGVVMKPAADRVLGRERDRVQHAVDPAPALAQRRRRRASRSASLLTSSSSTSTGSGSRCGGALGHPPHPAEARQHDRGALALGLLGGVEGDRVLGDHAGDQQPLAGQDHRPAPCERAERPREPLARVRRARPARRRTRRPPPPRPAGARRRKRRPGASRSASGSPAARSSRRLTIPTAARALMIPSSASGHASTRSAPRSREFIVMYAPP